MTTLILDTEPLSANVFVEQGKLIVELADGRSLYIPLD